MLRMAWMIVIAAAVQMSGLLAPLPAAASDRHGLVIGIDRYAHVPALRNARADARGVAAALEEAGFAVTLLLDANRRQLNHAFSEFLRSITPGGEAVVYFAGHGIEVRGRNFLLPADIPEARPGQERFVMSEALAVDELLQDLRDAGARVSLLILDACRDNPFPRMGTRSLGGTRGLVRVSDQPRGTFVLYSAGHGEAALDSLGAGDRERNSVFTRALLPLMRTPGLTVQEMALEVREVVSELAATVGHDQLPAYYDQLTSPFQLVPAVASPPPPPPPPPPPGPTGDGCVAALPLWEVVQASNSLASLRAFEASYAAVCPVLAALARDHIAALEAPGDATTGTPDEVAGNGFEPPGGGESPPDRGPQAAGPTHRVNVPDTGRLDVRAEADRAAEIVAQLGDGDRVRVLEITGNGWARIALPGNAEGWARSVGLLLPLAEGRMMVYPGGDLNARRGPGTDFAVVGVLRAGTEVSELRRDGNWSEVTVADLGRVWVHTSYLLGAEDLEEGSGPPSVRDVAVGFQKLMMA